MPGLTDSDESIEGVIRTAAEHGAGWVNPVVLHLRPGTKEWFTPWLQDTFPSLVPSYDMIYPRGYAYAPPEFQERILRSVAHYRQKWLATTDPMMMLPPTLPDPAEGQLMLLL